MNTRINKLLQRIIVGNAPAPTNLCQFGASYARKSVPRFTKTGFLAHLACWSSIADPALLAARISKLAESDAVPDLRKAGMKLEVHGWRKVKNRWVARVVDVS